MLSSYFSPVTADKSDYRQFVKHYPVCYHSVNKTLDTVWIDSMMLSSATYSLLWEKNMDPNKQKHWLQHWVKLKTIW